MVSQCMGLCPTSLSIKYHKEDIPGSWSSTDHDHGQGSGKEDVFLTLVFPNSSDKWETLGRVRFAAQPNLGLGNKGDTPCKGTREQQGRILQTRTRAVLCGEDWAWDRVDCLQMTHSR